MSILNHPIITERYFFPSPGLPLDPLWIEVDGARLACYRHMHHPSARTMLHFHGNGETVADYVPEMVEALSALGLNVVLCEFRGFGGATGTPTLQGMLGDGERIMDALALPPERTIAFGRSAGSIYALELIARHPSIAGLIIESGVADCLQRMEMRLTPQELGVTARQLEDEVRSHLDHRAKLAEYRGATLIMHTRRDSLVDVSHAHSLAEWAPEPTTKVIFEEGDHNSIFSSNIDAYLDQIAAFVASLP